MINKKWILNMGISFAFNGTKKQAEEKLKEDKKFLEEEVFTRDCTEYNVDHSFVIDEEKLQDKSYTEEMNRDKEYNK
jgi:hypothetical protein